MKKRFNRLAGGLVATAAAGAAIVSMTTTAAHAATTYTPSGGPSANFVGTNVSFTAQPSGQVLTCTTFNLSGSITTPGTSRAYGAQAGSLGTLSSSGCTNPIAGATTVTPIGTWKVAITGDQTAPGVWPAKLYDVKAYVSAANCNFYAGGASDTAGTGTGTGVVNGSFNTATQRFTPSATSTGLVISTPPVGSICPILDIYEDDTVQVGGYWTNTPPSGSTALAIANP